MLIPYIKTLLMDRSAGQNHLGELFKGKELEVEERRLPVLL